MQNRVCPDCGGTMIFKKSWELGAKGSTPITMNRFVCKNCGAELRIRSKEEQV